MPVPSSLLDVHRDVEVVNLYTFILLTNKYNPISVTLESVAK